MPFPGAGLNYPGQCKWIIPVIPTVVNEDDEHTPAIISVGLSAGAGTDFARYQGQATNNGMQVSGDVTDEFPVLPQRNNASDGYTMVFQAADSLFDYTMLWRAPIDFVMRKLSVNLCFGLLGTTPDPITGAPSLDTVFINVTQFTGGTEFPVLLSSGQGLTYSTGLPTMAAAGATNTQVFWLQDSVPVNKLINAGDFVRFHIRVDGEIEGLTSVSQGIFPVFEYQPDASSGGANQTTLSCFTLEGMLADTSSNIPLRQSTVSDRIKPQGGARR